MTYWKCCEIDADVSAVLIRVDGFITNKRIIESLITKLKEAMDEAFPEPCADIDLIEKGETFTNPPPQERYTVKVNIHSITEGKIRIPQPDELIGYVQERRGNER